VENITFLHCGTDVGLPPPVPEHPEYVQIAALWFVNVTNLLISQVILRNSTGYAIIGLELGNVSIVGPMFIHNGGQTGGNVYLAISQSTMEKCVQNTSITVTIQGCMFAHGTGTFLFRPGLDVFIYSCINVDIIIADSYFLNNTYKGNANQRTSGNLGISIDVGSNPSFITVQNCFIEQGNPNGMYLIVDLWNTNNFVPCLIHLLLGILCILSTPHLQITVVLSMSSVLVEECSFISRKDYAMQLMYT